MIPYGAMPYFLLIYDYFISTQESSLSILQVVLPSGESVVETRPSLMLYVNVPERESLFQGLLPQGLGLIFTVDSLPQNWVSMR